jgi:hypothetical protein
VTGATTSPLPLKNALFRQALASSTTSWSGTDGKHPVLAVALSPMIVELNSGESQTFEAGDVILLEDVLLAGHRMRSAGGGDLKVLYLTLPQQHYHAGKEHLSIKIGAIHPDPCPNESSSFGRVKEKPSASGTVILDSNGRRIRMYILAAIGMSFSTLAADFLGKTAPLWLAVGVGGTCFVGGGTFAFTVAGDKLIAAIELWRERRRLGAPVRDVEEERREESPLPEGLIR